MLPQEIDKTISKLPVPGSLVDSLDPSFRKDLMMLGVAALWGHLQNGTRLGAGMEHSRHGQ